MRKQIIFCSGGEITQEQHILYGPSLAQDKKKKKKSVFIPNDLCQIPWFFTPCEISNLLIMFNKHIEPTLNVWNGD